MNVSGLFRQTDSEMEPLFLNSQGKPWLHDKRALIGIIFKNRMVYCSAARLLPSARIRHSNFIDMLLHENGPSRR